MNRILHTDYFVPDQWQLEEMARVLRVAKVKVVTDGLPPATLRRLFADGRAGKLGAGRFEGLDLAADGLEGLRAFGKEALGIAGFGLPRR